MEDKEEENKEKFMNKKRKQPDNDTENNEQYKKKPKTEPRKSRKKILNEYYNLKPVIKIENNIRFIEPYEFKYQLYIKRRWLGKKLLDVLKSEFHSYNEEYFIKAIDDAKILINEKKTSKDYILKDNDFLTHLTIRKENPIIYKKLDIVFDDKNYLVVDKPSSWPVHVCGAYNFNTLQRILMDEYKYQDIKILHRLDKQTSGIVIFAKNKEAADSFREKLHTDAVQKIYFARVKGKFEPQDKKVIVKKYIKVIDKSRGIHTDVDEKEVEEYFKTKGKEEWGSKIKKIETKEEDNDQQKNEGGDDEFNEKNEPKYAETEFEFLFYDEKSNTSVVKCYPRTGRTHQIRIHLRVLGFPIANDPCYGGIIYNDIKEFESEEVKEYQINTQNEENISVSELFCYKIWLHAWKYKFDNYTFETNEPDWSKKDYIVEHKF